MSEEAKEITVKVKYDPNKDDTIDVKINPNATVYYFKQAIRNELEKKDINDIPVKLLKFNGQELDDENKTLGELGIKDGNNVENENRVVLIKTFIGKTIYITCDENTTVRELLKKLKGKKSKFDCDYIRLVFAGKALQRSILDQKLLGYQMGKKSIKYGDFFHLLLMDENSNGVFDLNNLEESKNSNLVKVSKTLETDNNVFNLERLDNNPRISLGSKKESKNSNYPPFRIIVGIADLLLLAAAVATFLLNIHIVATTVLATLFLVGGILFFGWNTILPKILPKGCLEKINSGADLGKENEYEIDEKENDKGNNPKEKEKYKGKKKEEEEEYN